MNTQKRGSARPTAVFDEEKPVFYKQAEDALRELDTLLGKSHPAAMESVLEMTELLIRKNRRFVFYLGAGCSKAVRVKQEKGSVPYKALSWEGLLEELFMEKLTRAQRAEFLKTMSRRVELPPGSDIEDFTGLLRYFGEPQVACFLSSFFKDRDARDDAIRKIVEPSLGLEYASSLHHNLLRLPFDDIVTTNYDTHIKHFLDLRFAKHSSGGDEKPFLEVTDLTGLKATFNGSRTHRLIYLHGKVHLGPSERRSRLIFDRFDYAEMLAERDGMLDYVTYLLRDSHVIYVGFGLDDPTFNLMESRLRVLQGDSRPQSFAFIPVVTESERKEWAGRRLQIIDYGEHADLPKILKLVLTIKRFINDAEPERPAGESLKKDRTGPYMASALLKYVGGDYENSLRECRAALASTLFWEREMSSGAEGGAGLQFREAARVCEIRIRLALNRYKLQWGPGKVDQGHRDYLSENIEAADKIIGVWEKNLHADKKHRRTTLADFALLALKQSLRVLQARISYLEGQFRLAHEQYTAVAHEGTRQALGIRKHDDTETVIWKLKIAEAFYYAKCQISRIDYQFLRESNDGIKGKHEQVREMEKVADDIGKVRHFIAQSEDDCGTLPEWEYFRNSMGTIYLIARWTAGRHLVRICQDVIPTRRERSEDSRDQLSRGIKLLEEELSEEEPSNNDQNVWKLSPRWRAYRYRYQCRAYALSWVVSQQPGVGQSPNGDADLIDAYQAIQNALEETKGSGLERQRIVNWLEATRLNILAMFGEQISKGRQVEVSRVSPLSFGAGMHYLDLAFREMERVEQKLRKIELAEQASGEVGQADRPVGKKRHISWLRILSYRLASYFALVSGQTRGNEIQRVLDQKLRDFFKLSVEKMAERVEQGYREFAENLGEPGALERRVKYYNDTLKTIRGELRGMSNR